MKDHAAITATYAPPNTNLSSFTFDPEWSITAGTDGSIVVGHLQTRDANLSCQTYYSAVPNIPFLVITYAQCTDLPTTTSRVGLHANGTADIVLDHVGTQGAAVASMLQEAMRVNEEALSPLGFIRLNPASLSEVTSDVLSTIYHYHGSSVEALDDNQKVKATSNVYVADASSLPYDFGGSTSVPVAVAGYRTAESVHRDTS